jgi:hypothetical protein
LPQQLLQLQQQQQEQCQQQHQLVALVAWLPAALCLPLVL